MKAVITPGKLAAIALAFCGISAAGAAETLIYETGFEAPDFVAGNINTQDGWSSRINAAVNYDAFVSTARPASGAQSIMMKLNVLASLSSASYDTSPALISLGGPDDFFITAKVFVEQAAVPYDPPFDFAEGTWGMGLITPLGGLVGMNIKADGTLAYAHMNSPTQTIVDTGLSLHGTWVTLTMRRDDVTHDRILLSAVTDQGAWNGVMGMPTTTTMSSVFYIGGGRGSFDTATAPAPWAYFDDVRIGYNLDTSAPVPEPGTGALLLGGLASVGLMLRRRRDIGR